MNNYDKELLKTTPNMIKGIAVQSAQLPGNQNESLSFDDVCKMANFSLALGCQISETEKVSTAKLATECVVGGALLVLGSGALEAKIAELEFPHLPHFASPTPSPFHQNHVFLQSIHPRKGKKQVGDNSHRSLIVVLW